MSRFSDAVGRSLRTFAMCSFGVICLLMIVSVGNRFVPLGSMGWSDEIIELLLVWTLFAGIAEVWRQGLHFHVDVVPQLLAGSRVGASRAVFVSAGCLVFQLTFVWQSVDLLLQANDVSPIFSWSRRWWYLPMPLAGLIMAVVSAGDLLSQWRTLMRFDPLTRTVQPKEPQHE